jgi:hypothetical protein
MELCIMTEKIGNVWIGSIDGYPEIAERALTKQAAEEKARQLARRIERGEYTPPPATARRQVTGRRIVERICVLLTPAPILPYARRAENVI